MLPTGYGGQDVNVLPMPIVNERKAAMKMDGLWPRFTGSRFTLDPAERELV